MGGSDVVVVGELPVLPPIKTSLIGREKPAQAVAAAEEECVTPKTEEHVLKPAVVCPPAPRKPRPAKRALHEQAPSTKGFHVVPRDLTSVFLTLPPKKRIRIDGSLSAHMEGFLPLVNGYTRLVNYRGLIQLQAPASMNTADSAIERYVKQDAESLP